MPREMPDRRHVLVQLGPRSSTIRQKNNYKVERDGKMGSRKHTRWTSSQVLNEPPGSEHKTDFQIRVVVFSECGRMRAGSQTHCFVKAKEGRTLGMGMLGSGSRAWAYELFSPCRYCSHQFQCHQNTPHQTACQIHLLLQILANTSHLELKYLGFLPLSSSQ